MNLGIVVAGDPWRFFKEIYEDLSDRYPVTLFERRRLNAPFFHTRINRYLFQRDLETFLASQDLVFFEWASDLLAAATNLPAERLEKRARIVTRLHRYEMFQWTHRINWDNVDRIILVSHAMQEKFARRFPENAHKTTVIYEGVSTRKFQPVEKPFAGDLGTLCFLNPRKRVYELILAFAELDKKYPGLKLHIGGSSQPHGDYRDALESLVGRLGLGQQVIFYGDISEPWTWYPNIDIFISNSYSEGLQVAPMEAMASQRYTLSHWWDGAEDLLPEENLFLTNADLHEKVISYCELPEAEKRSRSAEMRRLACEKFDLELIKAQVRDVIEEVAESIPASK